MSSTRLFHPFMALWIAMILLAGCGSDDSNEKPKDTTPPLLNILMSNVEITGADAIVISGDMLSIGDMHVAAWSDEITRNCHVKMTFDGRTISSGETPKKSGTLILTVSDDAGNSKTANITLVLETIHPVITVNTPEFNVFGGAKVEIQATQVLVAGEVAASWTDKTKKPLEVVVKCNGRTVADGDLVNEEGTLSITVTNIQNNSATAEIALVFKPLSGLDGLKDLSLQEGKEVNLLKGISFAEGVTLMKTEIEIEGQREEVPDPEHFTPSRSGNAVVIFTVKAADETTTEVKSDTLIIQPAES